jgi:hypothetical protein
MASRARLTLGMRDLRYGWGLRRFPSQKEKYILSMIIRSSLVRVCIVQHMLFSLPSGLIKTIIDGRLPSLIYPFVTDLYPYIHVICVFSDFTFVLQTTVYRLGESFYSIQVEFEPCNVCSSCHLFLHRSIESLTAKNE